MPNSVQQGVYLGDLRVKYKDRSESFCKDNLIAKEPIGQFHAWFEEALKTKEIIEPNAICLATATKDGKPRNRFVLLKSYSAEGFKFFTNYESQKAKDLEENPQAAFTIYWQALKRQVRVEGKVEKLPEIEGEEYFKARPYDNQVGSAASKQSSVIPSRDTLINKCKELMEEFPQEVPKPPSWGGYIIIPNRIEFWQGQSDRLHDRIVFRRPSVGEVSDPETTLLGDNGWLYERLSP